MRRQTPPRPCCAPEAGRNPYDRDLSDLIGELSTRSETFRNRWANHNARLHRTGTKIYHHPVVGRLTLEFEVMELSADTGLALTAFTAAHSASHDGRALLAVDRLNRTDHCCTTVRF